MDVPVDARVIDAPPPDTEPCFGPDGDGDGKVDVCDPCPFDSPDDPDLDGVCTAADRCLTGNDAADADSDTVPDACDTWPCGAAPAALPTFVAWTTPTENVTLTAIDGAGMGQRIVVNPGAVVAVTATFSIIDCECPNCIDQIEVGLIPGGKLACFYNGNPQGSSVSGCTTPTIDTATRNLTAPTTPGAYAIRFNRGNDNSCQLNGAWWANSPPGAGTTIAMLCVR